MRLAAADRAPKRTRGDEAGPSSSAQAEVVEEEEEGEGDMAPKEAEEDP